LRHGRQRQREHRHEENDFDHTLHNSCLVKISVCQNMVTPRLGLRESKPGNRSWCNLYFLRSLSSTCVEPALLPVLASSRRIHQHRQSASTPPREHRARRGPRCLHPTTRTPRAAGTPVPGPHAFGVILAGIPSSQIHREPSHA
jgi:hypothetical protein